MGDLRAQYMVEQGVPRVVVSEGGSTALSIDVEDLSGSLVYATPSRREAEPATEDREDALRAAATNLGEVCSEAGQRLLVWRKPETSEWREALGFAGWVIENEKQFVRRELDASVEELLPSEPAVQLEPLRACGELRFIERMTAAAQGDPFMPEDQDPHEAWRELVEYAGERFDPAHWFLVSDARGPIGVLLPQALDDSQGTCFYLGVLPARRGQGWGHRLHALGLLQLRERGLSTYIGSTDTRNVAMQRVFARNACPVTGTQQFLRWHQL